MSLQIWLPLNGSLKNNGVSTAPLTTKGISTSTGKISSSCANFASGDYISFSNANFINANTKNITIAFWLKTTSTSAMTFMCDRSNTGSGFALFQISATSFRFDMGGAQTTFNHNLNLSNWTHLCFTADGSTKKMYVNGNLHSSISYSGTQKDVGNNLYIGGSLSNTNTGGATSNNHFIGQMQDYRIYDNTLSAKEIKEISKGLMIHYPMRDPQIGGVDNLVVKPVATGDYTNSTWDATLHPGAKQVSGWSAGYNSGVKTNGVTAETGYHAYWKIIDNIPTMVMINNNSIYNAKGRWMGVSSNSSVTITTGIKNAGVYTISFDAKTDTPGTKITGGLHSRLTSATSDAFNDGQFSIYPTKNWQRYSVTVIPNANIDATKASRIYFYGNAGAEGIIYIRNPQIVGGTSSVYVGDNVVSSGLCIDSSGNKNHATVAVGTVNYDKKSPRGTGSFNFKANSVIRTNNILVPKEHTISLWVNRQNYGHVLDWRDSGSSTGLQPLYFNELGQIQYWSSAASTAASDYFSFKFNTNTWYHIALVCAGSTVKLYVNGIEEGSKATGIGDWTLPLSIGARCSNTNMINAKIADFRIYSTALTDAEISNLYNTPIWIAKNGTVGAITFKESDIDKIKFAKTGIAEGFETSEISKGMGMKFKVLNDGSSWARIHWLDVSEKSEFFANATEVAECTNKMNRYSLMGKVDNFKNANGVYEFMLTYPQLSSTLYNRWTQTSSPNASAVTGFTAITTAWSNYNAGIRKHGPSCVYNCSTESSWYAPIGQTAGWTNGSIPGANGSQLFETELWVRIDTLSEATKFKLYNSKYVVATEILEI